MKHSISLAAACAFLAGGLCVAVFAADAKPVALEGTAVWNGDNKKVATVTATLTPTGEKETYSAVWMFTWDGKKNTWKGKVQGNLKNGDITGDGATLDGKRTFIFKATSVNGVITGQHWETTGGKTKLSGTLKFKV